MVATDPSRAEVIRDAQTMAPQGFEDLKTSSKTEGADRPLAAALWLIGLDGGADEELSGEDWYVVRVGRFIAIENVQGFVSADDHGSAEEAEKIMADLGSEEARAADAALDEELDA